MNDLIPENFVRIAPRLSFLRTLKYRYGVFTSYKKYTNESLGLWLNAIPPDRLLVWILTMKTRSLQFASGGSGTSQRTTPRSIMFGNFRPGPLCTCSVDNRPPTSRCLAEVQVLRVNGHRQTGHDAIDHQQLSSEVKSFELEESSYIQILSNRIIFFIKTEQANTNKFQWTIIIE